MHTTIIMIGISLRAGNSRIVSGPMVVCLRDWPGDRRIASSIPETIDFLTNSSGQATNAPVSLFTKQCKLIPAS